MVISNINQTAFVYRNNVNDLKERHFIDLELIPKKGNTLLGTKVYLEDDGQFIELTNVRGMYSTSEQRVHFGVNKRDTVSRIKIVWSDGMVSFLENIPTDTIRIVKQEECILTNQSKVTKQPNNKLFQQIEISGLQWRHTENDYDDYQQQILLPHKLSQFGPALAVADVNGDGFEDIYFGGASGQKATLYLQSNQGVFYKSSSQPWHKDMISEDIDALFFDLDGDDDKDLYVVSGGNAFVDRSDEYSDRIYINDGKGIFHKDIHFSYVKTSGSCVRVADYDNDGDLDVFVGGRHTPHLYPTPAESIFLKNDKGILKKEKIPDLESLGMVTDALWTDYDNDGDLDLMIVGEWMGIVFFENNSGHLKKQVIEGLDNMEGWWFSVAKGDFDLDGDDDYLVGNLGLNYKYKASPKYPFDIYYDDFDHNGKKDVVLGYYNFGKHYPLRGFSCSMSQVPRLKKDIGKYNIFAKMDIGSVYGKKKLSKALYYKSTDFASYYIENLGNRRFAKKRLPLEAQLSNINDFALDDFNDDGNLDFLTVGNFYVSEIETTRNDSSYGEVFLGDGKGNFENIPYQKSGFFNRGDAKKVKPIKVLGKKVWVVVNNNAMSNTFRIFRKP